MANYQSVVPNQLAQAQVTGTVATIYTVPALTRTFVKDIDIANTTGGAITLSLWLVPSGQSAGNAYVLLPSISVVGNGVVQWTGSQIILPNATIQVQASGSGLTITISGGEAT